MERARVLVVDDKPNMLKLFTRILEDRYQVSTALDGTQGLTMIGAEQFDVVVTDLRMPGADGFEILRAVKSRCPETEVIMMTAYATVQDAVTAMKHGAYDYLPKPFDPDEASLVVARALEHKSVVTRNLPPRAPDGDVQSFHNLLGQSPAMREVFRLLEKAAASDITVLLTGETGTGKEVAARAIHSHGPRREYRFVPVNCGALPHDLIESELFGHARGAFTGAAGAKPGLFEVAEGGTLFLDEVGELPLPMQVKLNRALQDREIRRVGDNTPIKVDVRIMAATHRNLQSEIQAGHFREDLFYRLHVFPIRLPALRERREDIPLLTSHFLDKHSNAVRRTITGFHPDAMGTLLACSWPGNVRQLENTVERAVAITNGPEVTVADLPAELQGAPPSLPRNEQLVQIPYREAVDLARDQASREYLVALLRTFEGNVTRAAERAGVERESLHRLLKRYGIRSEDFKKPT